MTAQDIARAFANRAAARHALADQTGRRRPSWWQRKARRLYDHAVHAAQETLAECERDLDAAIAGMLKSTEEQQRSFFEMCRHRAAIRSERLDAEHQKLVDWTHWINMEPVR